MHLSRSVSDEKYIFGIVVAAAYFFVFFFIWQIRSLAAQAGSTSADLGSLEAPSGDTL